MLEPICEARFYKHSYGFRPNRSTHHAKARFETLINRACLYHRIDVDIKGLFDNIDHDLLMRAVEKHTQNKWLKLYIRRWLKAPFHTSEGIIERTSGTLQGGLCEALHNPPYAK